LKADDTISKQMTLEPDNDNQRLALLCGQCDENIQLIEDRLKVSIKHRGHEFSISGDDKPVDASIEILKQLYHQTANNKPIELHDIHIFLRSAKEQTQTEPEKIELHKEVILHTKIGSIKGRTKNQSIYLKKIFTHDVNFGIGPAGTGKTFLAVACAIDALEKDLVKRLVLVRPAVEAGERLGFLPGDLAQKVDPYLRPIYDALYAMLGFDRVNQLLEKHIIEIAPLAYMRGRTLNDAFIILDEAQNTTPEQMKMFLTRIGFGSKTVITGDVTQIDLMKSQRSGLKHVLTILDNIDNISFTNFTSQDVVRHPIVQSIINAYEKNEHIDHTHE
jgi:phosphate starvation-inducible protein PhoH and related proteins